MLYSENKALFHIFADILTTSIIIRASEESGTAQVFIAMHF